MFWNRRLYLGVKPMNLGVRSVFLVSVVLSYDPWLLLSICVEGLGLSALGFCLGFWLRVLVWLHSDVIGGRFGVWGVPWGCFFFWSFSLLFQIGLVIAMPISLRSLSPMLRNRERP